MDEIPAGVSISPSKVTTPRPSSSVMISRLNHKSYEILLGHRVSELPSFPDIWSFPGGGVSWVDKKNAELHPSLLSGRKERIQIFTLLREMAEELGISPDGNGGFLELDAETREVVCLDKQGWGEALGSEKIDIDGFDCEVITERVTPPQAPYRFHNLFFHTHIGDSRVIPSFPPGRSEFDEFRWWTPSTLISSWERNEIRLPPPIITILRDLLNEMEEDGDLLEACGVLASDPPSGTHRYEYGPGVECILIPTETLPPATHTNCYILGERGGQRVIIDPAVRDRRGLEILADKVDEIKSDHSKIVATIFTHKHKDHIGDIGMISEIYDAPIRATEETLSEIIEDVPVRFLSEGELVTLDGPNGSIEWKVIETPGHCPGQICLVGDAGIVSADNCTSVGTILIPSADGDMGSYILGLEKLRSLDPNVLFPGHGPLIPNPKRVLTEYIDHRIERREKVLQAIISGAKSIEQITKIAYSGDKDAHPLLARDQALSHIKELLSSEKIRKVGEQYEST